MDKFLYLFYLEKQTIPNNDNPPPSLLDFEVEYVTAYYDIDEYGWDNNNNSLITFPYMTYETGYKEDNRKDR